MSCSAMARSRARCCMANTSSTATPTCSPERLNVYVTAPSPAMTRTAMPVCAAMMLRAILLLDFTLSCARAMTRLLFASPAGSNAASHYDRIFDRGIARRRHHILKIGLNAEMAVQAKAVGGFESGLPRAEHHRLARAFAETGMGERKSRLVGVAAERGGIDKPAIYRGVDEIDAVVGKADAHPAFQTGAFALGRGIEKSVGDRVIAGIAGKLSPRRIDGIERTRIAPA